MISIYELKPHFQQLLSPAAAALHKTGVTANMVTVAAMLLSIGYGAAMLALPRAKLLYLLLPAFLFARMALNALDGMLAREYRQQSSLGALLNEVGDVISDTALLLPFAFLDGVSAMLVAAVVFLSLLVEFVGVIGQVIAGSRRYDGPMGKSDRAFALGLLSLLIGWNTDLINLANGVFTVISVLLVASFFNRMRSALRLAIN